MLAVAPCAWTGDVVLEDSGRAATLGAQAAGCGDDSAGCGDARVPALSVLVLLAGVFSVCLEVSLRHNKTDIC